MSENHQRCLVATFSLVDSLLDEAGHVLVVANSTSPFVQYTQATSPVHRKVIDDYIRRVRDVMSRVMTALNLPRPAPACDVLWAAQARITSAQSAVAEIRPNKRATDYLHCSNPTWPALCCDQDVVPQFFQSGSRPQFWLVIMRMIFRVVG